LFASSLSLDYFSPRFFLPDVGRAQPYIPIFSHRRRREEREKRDEGIRAPLLFLLPSSGESKILDVM